MWLTVHVNTGEALLFDWQNFTQFHKCLQFFVQPFALNVEKLVEVWIAFEVLFWCHFSKLRYQLFQITDTKLHNLSNISCPDFKQIPSRHILSYKNTHADIS